eukprot:1162078-Pelagomonas_calceolata.AAC.7
MKVSGRKIEPVVMAKLLCCRALKDDLGKVSFYKKDIPDAILVTPCLANQNRPPTPSSHRVLRSMRRNEVVRSSTTPARQLHELNIQKRHIHLIEIKYCEDTRPGAS